MRWVICLAFVLCNSAGIFAQATVNTEGEFLAALDKANNLDWFLQSSPYRKINTGEIILNFRKENFDKQLSSYKTVSEYDKKTGKHTTYEVSKNFVKEKYESVEIRGKDGRYFERKNDGDWLQVEELSKNVSGGLYLGTSKEYKRLQEVPERNQTPISCKYLGREKINNQTADVYVTFEKRAETSGENIRTETRKFWFAQDGKILKIDWELIIESDGGSSRSHYTQTWETDENIKIEAPTTFVAQ